MTAITLGRPHCIRRASGHFWFPALHAMATGHLLCLVPTVTDEAHGHWEARLLVRAPDETQWRDQGTLLLGWASLSIAANALLLLPFNLFVGTSPREARGMISRLVSQQHGVIQQISEPVVVHALPYNFKVHPDGRMALLSSGDGVVQLPDGRWFTTLYGVPHGAKKYLNLAIVSDDGYDWRFLSVIATADALADNSSGLQGPCETATVLLGDGRLFCVYRVGSGAAHPYFCSVSHDQGQSWGAPRRMPGVASVKPQLLKLESGRLLLAGGRPGLFLWCSEDTRNWESIDIFAHHNRHVASADMFALDEVVDLEDKSKTLSTTTSYISLCRSASGDVLAAYDRLANGWKGAPGFYGQQDAVFCLNVTAS